MYIKEKINKTNLHPHLERTIIRLLYPADERKSAHFNTAWLSSTRQFPSGGSIGALAEGVTVNWLILPMKDSMQYVTNIHSYTQARINIYRPIMP